MKRIPLTQGQYAIVDDEDYEWLMQWKWCAHRERHSIYAVRNRRRSDGPGPRHISMHRVILNPPDGMETDHVNGVGWDNRKQNLRAVTSAINHANQIHGHRRWKHDLPMGVSPHGRRFMARITINGHMKYLGTFDTPDEAHAAYVAARRERLSKWEMTSCH